jgi:hypothetical protein
VFIKKFIKRVETDMKTLNDEYEALSKMNNIKAKEINHSIESKTKEFQERKKQADKHFNVIRNK